MGRTITVPGMWEQDKNIVDTGWRFGHRPGMRWDASIDLVTAHLEPGNRDYAGAVAAVRRAVEGLPGAGWVSVAWCGSLPGVRWLRVYPEGGCLPVEGYEWDGVRRQVERAVAAALV